LLVSNNYIAMVYHFSDTERHYS